MTVPTAPPQNVAIQTATATQLDVTWDPPPANAQNGDIQGYKVRLTGLFILQQIFLKCQIQPKRNRFYRLTFRENSNM